MKGLVFIAFGAAFCAFGVGCSSDPIELAGDYTVAITSRDNGCNYSGWTVGNMSTGVEVVITQSGSSATATVNGASGVVLDAFVGGHVFDGPIDGDSFDLVQHGTKSATMGNCTYTITADIVGKLAGDAISGSVNYTDATNGGSDCAALMGCRSFQDYNGARPPR